MEQCTIYSHQTAFDKVIALVREQLPKARIDVEQSGTNGHLTAVVSGGLFSKGKTLTLNYRQRTNPSYKLEKVECPLTQNLAGMANYVSSISTTNNELKNRLVYKIMSINSEMAFMAEPSINKELEALLRSIARELDAIIFAQPGHLFRRSQSQYFADKDLNLILDPQGNSAVETLSVVVDARYHDGPQEDASPEQRQRKENSEAYLQSHGIRINRHLPYLPPASGINVRSLDEIIERAYALLVLAAKGEGVEQEHLDRAIAAKKIDGFTPVERPLIKAGALTEEQRAYATWRYESLAVLLWALGKIPSLAYPSTICDVPAVVGLIFQPAREAFVPSVRLRTKAELLDELDKIYRMNWACVDARIKGEQVSGNIDAGVVYERHYALNWLTCYQDQDWDDVQTNT